MIRMSEPYLDKEELKNVTEAITDGAWISSNGRFLNEFSEGFAKYIGEKYAVTACNGTAALHLAIAALGIGKGDNVLIPTLTNISCANSVRYVGAEPIFVDSEKDYWCIDPKDIEKKINKKTKAIMVVHLYGHPCDMNPIMKIANEHDVPVIEDCAEAHGAEYKGKKVGTFGLINCFSFYGNKIITTGEGGMCLTNDPELANKIRAISDQRFQASTAEYKKNYYFDIFGYNYRMTNLEAAIGVAQLKKIDHLVERRRWLAKTYNKFFAGHKGIITAPEMKWAKNVYWYYSILVDKSKRDKITKALEEKGIESRHFFYPLHKVPIYKSNEKLPVAEDLGSRGLNLPSGPQLEEKQIKEVADAVIAALK